MIQEAIYRFAKRNVEQFAKAGPDDSNMSLSLVETELKYRITPKEHPDYVMHGYVSLAISAAIIHRYEEQNNLAEAATQISTNP